MDDDKNKLGGGKKETIEINKSELAELIALNKKLLARVGEERAPKAKAVKEHTVSICFVNDKPVIGYANKGTASRPTYVYALRDINDPKREVLYVDLLLHGQKEPIKQVSYNDFVRDAEVHHCIILETHKDEWVYETGVTGKKVIKDEDWRSYMEETGEVVPLEVRGVKRTFTVQLPDGSKMDIDENYVNIKR